MSRWRCSRCGASNDAVGVTCSRCGSSRGAVVLPGAPPDAPPHEASPIEQPPVADIPIESHWGTPAGVEAETAAPGSTPLWRRIPIGMMLVIGFIAVGAVTSWFGAASRSENGEITRSGDLDASELRVGDCFDLKDPEAETIELVTARQCSEEHAYETFFVGSMPVGGYPDDGAFETYVVATCEPAFEAYVGTAYQSSRLGMSWFWPTSEAWLSGDRSIQCVLEDPQRPRLTTSLRGSNL